MVLRTARDPIYRIGLIGKYHPYHNSGKRDIGLFLPTRFSRSSYALATSNLFKLSGLFSLFK